MLKVETMKERTERLRRETASLRQSLVYSPRPEYSSQELPTPTRMDPPIVAQPATTPVWASPTREPEAANGLAAQEKSAVVKLTELVAELKRQLDKAKNDVRMEELQKAEMRIKTLELELEMAKRDQPPATPDGEVTDLKNTITKQDNEIATLTTRINELEQSPPAPAATSELEATITSLRQQLQSATGSNSELEEAKQKITDLQSELSQLQNQPTPPAESTASDLEAANTKIAELETKLNEVEVPNNSELEAANTKIAELEAKLASNETPSDSTTAITELQTELTQQQELNEDIKSKLLQESEQLAAANGKVDELELKISSLANLETELQSANDTISEQKSELEASKQQLSRLAELEEAGGNWKAKIEELTTQIEQQQEGSPNSRMKKLQDENEAANATIAELKKQLQQSSESSKRISELEERSTLGDDRIAELTMKVSELEQTNDDQHKEIEQLKKQLEVDTSDDSVTTLKKQLATVEAENESLTDTAKARNAQIAELQKEVERLTITVAEPQMMEMTITTLRSTISQLQDSQSSLKKQLAESEKRHHHGGNKNLLMPYSNSACNESACNFSDVRYEQSVDMSSITDRSCSALSMKSARCPPPTDSGPVFYLAAMIGASGGMEASPSLTFCLESAPRPGETPADHANRVQGEKPVILELPNSVHDKIRPSVNAVELHCDDPDKRVIQLGTPRSKMIGLSMLQKTGIPMQEYSGHEADFVVVQSPGVSEVGSENDKSEKPVVLEVPTDIHNQILNTPDVNAEDMGSSSGIHMLKLSSPRSKMNGLQLLQNAGLHLEERSTDEANIITATESPEAKELFAEGEEPLLMGNLPAALEDSVRSEISPSKIQSVTLDGIEMLSISSPRSKMVGLSLLQGATENLTEADLESPAPIVLGNLPKQATDSITASVEVDRIAVSGIQMLRLSSPRSKMRGLSMLNRAFTPISDASTTGPLHLGNLPDNLVDEMKKEIPCAKEIEGEDGTRVIEIDSPRSKMESIELLESAGLKTILTDKEGIDMLLLSSPRRGRGVSILRRAAAVPPNEDSDSFYVAAMVGAAGGSTNSPSLTKLLNTERIRES
eukprot:TRINITY_DN2609_c0_g1_i1.p1 TRINITY_DN2609_c0_g1~~TRINITY_DN2609_c0_g1_i1.p1  ORF type:complete len:1208 (+),score=368.61 TRINITY_DN2609_c0_g1_i1:395-3625(+)